MKNNETPYGFRILLEKILEKDVPLDNEGKFKHKVTTIKLGDTVKDTVLEPGMTVRIIEGAGVELEANYLLIVEQQSLSVKVIKRKLNCGGKNKAEPPTHATSNFGKGVEQKQSDYQPKIGKTEKIIY